MVERVAMVTVAVVLAGAMVGTEARAVDPHTREQVAIEKEAIASVEQVEEVGWDYHHLDDIKTLVI